MESSSWIMSCFFFAISYIKLLFMIISYQLELGEGIECTIELKKVKHIYLRIDKNWGNVRVVAPKNGDKQLIKDFLLSKLDWIKGHQEKIRTRKILPQKEFLEGESHFLFGKNYQLKIEGTGKANKVFVDNQYLVLQIKDSYSQEKRKLLVENFYRLVLQKEIPLLIKKWEPLMDVKVTEFGVKRMKTKWGTCNILAKRIWLNLELAKKPFVCLEYVVVHEMVHLLERNHNAKFHAHMTRFLPNWKETKVSLNEMGID